MLALTTLPKQPIWVMATLMLGLYGCSKPEPSAQQDAQVGLPVDFNQRCSAFSSQSAFGVQQAQVHDALVVQPRFAPPETLASHCELLGQLEARTGVDGQHYAIKYRLRLPRQWNGRFLMEGGGGTNGEVGQATGAVGASNQSALSRGFAVLSQDSGHSNETNANPNAGGMSAFGHDPLARANYGHASLKKVTDNALALVHDFYGKAPDYRYFFGCSKGGQEGMALVQKYPELYNGVVAAAPGMSLPRAAMAQVWDVQTFGALVTQGIAKQARAQAQAQAIAQSLPEAFSDEQLARVKSAVLAACDTLDGLQDGSVGYFSQCTSERVLPHLTQQVCSDDDSCLTQHQVDALVSSLDGPKTAAGEAIYAAWPWDAGVGDFGWRMWKLGSSQMPALNVLIGGQASASIFTVPPTAIGASPPASVEFALGFDVARDYQKIYATSDVFNQSAWQDISARSSDLDGFKAHSGKLIVPHGVSDAVFSITDTLNWFNEVDSRYQNQAQQFVRVFPVPGMGHCQGGASTDQFDALSAVMTWVEQGQAPEKIEAVASGNTPWPGRSRPLCPYPKIAVYSGEGSIEQSQNFTCQELK